MKLTFGKYKGEDLLDVPLDYIKWLEEQNWIQDDLRKECQFEIKRREGDVTSLGKDITKKEKKGWYKL